MPPSFLNASVFPFEKEFLFEQKETLSVSIYMDRILKPLASLLVVASLIVSISDLNAQTTTATTDVMGYSIIPLYSGGSAVVPPFVSPSSYSASSTFTGGSNLSATGLTAGSFNAVTGYPTFFVEICSGPYTGYYFPVVSNTSSTIVASGLPSDLGSVISIKVRPYTTLATVANGSAGLSDYADTFTLYKSNSKVSSFVFTSGGVLSDDYATPAGGVPIPPGTGFIVNNTLNSTATFIGEVDANQCVVPLNAGTTLVGPLNPMGGLNVTSINLASAIAPYTDSASLIASDGSLGITSFYSDGSSLLDSNYTLLTSNASPTVCVGNGFLVNAGQNSVWTAPSVLSN
jgi:hypothetical protein